MYSIYIGLPITERNQKSGRWVFARFLGLAITFHVLIVFDVTIRAGESFAKWPVVDVIA